MDEPIEIEKDNPIKLLMDEFAKRVEGMPGVAYCLAVDVGLEGWHVMRTNMALDSYLFAVFHTAVEIGQQRGVTKAKVLETIRRQLKVLDDE